MPFPVPPLRFGEGVRGWGFRMSRERAWAVEVVRRLRERGHEALWAGGCVRDLLLSVEPADYDVATSARPDEVRAIFPRSVAVGESFGVVTVLGRDRSEVQVATFRADGEYLDGRRPESVTFCSAEEDAKRRDFTINGMFFDPIGETVIDYVGGRADLEWGIIRAIGDAKLRFGEDKLRMVRAVRFATRFGFPIEDSTFAAMKELAAWVRAVSFERVADEMRKMLPHPRRAHGVRLLAESGLLVEFAHEAVAAGVRYDALERLTFPERPGGGPVTFPLALATLLIGVERRAVAALGQRWKLSNPERERVESLIARRGSLRDAASMSPSVLYPALVHPGVGELLALDRADDPTAGHVDYCLDVLRTTPTDALNPAPVLTGDDLMALGLTPGPKFKVWLDAARAAQLEGKIASRADAILFAQDLIERGGS